MFLKIDCRLNFTNSLLKLFNFSHLISFLVALKVIKVETSCLRASRSISSLYKVKSLKYESRSASYLTNSAINPLASASAVIWWYWLFTRGDVPTVVLRATMCLQNQPFAEIPQAARALSNRGLRVLIDTSDGALSIENLVIRSSNYIMEPMSKEVLVYLFFFCTVL
jgi:hypothetical protein